MKQVWKLHNLRGLSAAVYTQTADVETECNGLQTYDRAVAKIPTGILLAANHGEISGPPMKVILADALFGQVNWKYTTDKPADDWAKSTCSTIPPGKKEAGGFGTTGTPGWISNTTWDTSDIWLRRDFILGLEDMTRLKLQIFHDEDAEVYLNGMLAAKLDGYTTDYDEVDISKESRPGASARPQLNCGSLSSNHRWTVH